MSDTQFNTGVIRPVECFKEGWELIKPDYWILFAISFVGALIGGFTMCILLGAMYCGMFYCYLKRLDGQTVSFEDLWKGFEWWVPSLIVTLIMVVPAFVVSGLFTIPLALSLAMGSKLSEGELISLLITAGIIEIVLVIVMVCFHTLLLFSFPLIVDRNLGAVDAMKTSAKAVWKNLGGVVGMIACQFGLILAGELALCVGIYFVIPVVIAGNMVAFRKVFPRTAGQSTNPPPPEPYPAA